MPVCRLCKKVTKTWEDLSDHFSGFHAPEWAKISKWLGREDTHSGYEALTANDKPDSRK